MKKLIAASLLTYSGMSSALVINAENSGVALANSLIGSGITIDNSSVNYIGASGQAGFFKNGSSSVGIEQGVIMTTGLATNALGPNNVGNKSTAHGTAGDSDLTALGQGASTYDANVLSFDFTTTTGKLFFEFVLGSEEYNEYLNFHDVFGLFVNGQNVAKTPSGQAINIANVNCGADGVTTTPTNNCNLFRNNPSTNGTSPIDIQYDGLTKVFKIAVSGLNTSGTNTMKFAIADYSDSALDSGIFVKGNSFTAIDPTQVSEPATLGLLGLGLTGLLVSRRKKA